MDINVEKELNVIEVANEREKNKFTVDIPKDRRLVEI